MVVRAGFAPAWTLPKTCGWPLLYTLGYQEGGLCSPPCLPLHVHYVAQRERSHVVHALLVIQLGILGDNRFVRRLYASCQVPSLLHCRLRLTLHKNPETESVRDQQ